MVGAYSKYWGTGEMQTRFWWGNMKERGYLENLGVNGTVKLS
jgi:hypothetical protein